MSKYKVEIVPIKLSPCPNSDSLSIVNVGQYTCVLRTTDWENVQTGLWFEPDTLLDTDRPEFAFLKGEAKYDENSFKGDRYYKVKAKKIRGTTSFGLLIPAPTNVNEIENLFEYYGCAHWNEPEVSEGSASNNYSNEVASGPDVYAPKYDLENLRKYADIFAQGEPVNCFEKANGANTRFVYLEQTFYCGSRTEWKKEFPDKPDVDRMIADLRCKLAGKVDDNTIEEKASVLRAKFENWQPKQNKIWKAFRATPDFAEWLQAHEGTVVYCEQIGECKGYPYNASKENQKLLVFDILVNGRFMDDAAARLAAPNLPWVPAVAESIPYDFVEITKLAEGTSLLNNSHIREGVVVSPVCERSDPKVGRLKLKLINPSYLIKS